MKKKQGITIGIPTPPEEYARVAQSQRDYLNKIADMLENGEPLDSIGKKCAAGAIRAWPAQIPDQEPKKPGGQPTIDPGTVAVEFGLLRHLHGMSKNKAKESLAERFGVSVEAIKKALKKYGENDLLAWFPEKGGEPNK